jgi:hypothetical protein
MPKMGKVKTKAEIKAEIIRAEEFVKKYPISLFGDGNKKQVDIFKKMCNQYLAHEKTLDQLEKEACNEYLNESTANIMRNTIDWLHGDFDDDENEGHMW